MSTHDITVVFNLGSANDFKGAARAKRVRKGSAVLVFIYVY